MIAPRAADWRMEGRTDGRSRTGKALRVVLVIGVIVFCLAIAALARGVIHGRGLDDVALFWGAWSLVAGSLAFILMRAPR